LGEGPNTNTEYEKPKEQNSYSEGDYLVAPARGLMIRFEGFFIAVIEGDGGV
jgi:hypothetical protein